jgi:prophage tail gpP-like protein
VIVAGGAAASASQAIRISGKGWVTGSPQFIDGSSGGASQEISASGRGRVEDLTTCAILSSATNYACRQKPATYP